jgi:hypothetical protein
MHENPKDKGCFRRWESPEIRLKMYDAGKNIKQKQNKEMQEQIQAEGWDPERNNLKFEAHYKKPEALLNKGRRIMVAEPCGPKLGTEISGLDLYNPYKRLMPS